MRKLGIWLVIMSLLALVPTALAGGWATVTLDEPPGEIRAGEPWAVGLTVWQHGVTPVHNLGEDVPIEPALVATNAATGERVTAVAVPAEEVGSFRLEVTFPSEGEWEWTIHPAPLAGETQFKPLTVLPPLPATQPGAVATDRVSVPAPIVVGIAVLLIALGAVPWLSTRGRKAHGARISVE